MKYGIFGGSFNPIHNGHIIIMQLSIEYLKLDRLFVIPAYQPPHKRTETLAPFEKRYRWVIDCLKEFQEIEVNDYERKKGGLSYTIDTIEHFIKMMGERPYLIIGEDMAKMFHKWYKYEEIIAKSQVCVYPRYRVSPELSFKEKFLMMDLPLIQISSSDVRKRLKTGKSVKGFVPDSIIEELMEVYS
ncbi:MAG TPA: nicotinate (nicotinamide) nucleotide adenylyltransferase [Thermotogaceae bacterium]|nr:nicotinate (nicotinamide) nucleotide adenylyltransferase [Thermotogaceae bacterium]